MRDEADLKKLSFLQMKQIVTTMGLAIPSGVSKRKRQTYHEALANVLLTRYIIHFI